MATKKLTVKQQAFLGHYLGTDSELAGNATRSYMAAYPKSTEKSAGTAGPRLLENVGINEAIVKHQEKVAEKIDVTAETVLRDAIRFRDIAFGDLPGIYERMIKDPGTGEVRKVIENLRQFNPQALGKALELIGRKRLVQAFQDSVEVSHTRHLEELLNARMNQVEAAAAARQLRLVKDSPEPTSP